jgi:hypothetical protein
MNLDYGYGVMRVQEYIEKDNIELRELDCVRMKEKNKGQITVVLLQRICEKEKKIAYIVRLPMLRLNGIWFVHRNKLSTFCMKERAVTFMQVLWAE